MNTKEKDEIVAHLKEIILNNGFSYLNDNAYKVYEGLKVETNIKVAVLSCLLNGVCDVLTKRDIGYDDLLSFIKKNCLLNDDASYYMALIFYEIFSNENKKAYENEKYLGFNAFCNNVHEISWEGFTRWYSDMVHVDCSFEANFSFKVSNKEKIRKKNNVLLKKNPYLSEDYFYKKYKEDIIKSLDDDFEYYCTCDDYYPPDCEDYVCNCESLLEDYFKK